MINVIEFVKQTRLELLKVTWPTKEQTKKLTIVVIVVTLIVSFYLGLLDYLLNQLIIYIL